MYLTVVPAYGRDYKSKAAVLADWNAGKDFQINDMSSPDDGRYINKLDKPAGVTLSVRYKNLTMVTLIK
ncbi:MAG TPA: hypothetical protein VGG75_13605 [Trebonia sp.]|jgi:hypothetical protein